MEHDITEYKLRRRFYKEECNDRLEFLLWLAEKNPSKNVLLKLVYCGYVCGYMKGFYHGMIKTLNWSNDELNPTKKKWEL